MSEEQSIKTVPWEEIVSGGYLLEANRRFFHPLGLALYCSMDEEGKIVRAGVFDARDDKEGFHFENISPDDAARAREVQALLETKRAARVGRFGSVIQPLPEHE